MQVVKMRCKQVSFSLPSKTHCHCTGVSDSRHEVKEIHTVYQSPGAFPQKYYTRQSESHLRLKDKSDLLPLVEQRRGKEEKESSMVGMTSNERPSFTLCTLTIFITPSFLPFFLPSFLLRQRPPFL